MDLLYALFFAAGVAAFAYAKLGRSVGYGNAKSVWRMVGAVFAITFIFFYTLVRFVLGFH